MNGQGNLERTWKVIFKVREFENKWLWQADFRKFIYSVQRGKDVLSHEIVPLTLGVTLKGKNLLPWGANSFL